MKRVNEEFPVETRPHHHDYGFLDDSCGVSRKTYSAILDSLLTRIPDVSWGVLGDKFPEFTTFFTVTFIIPTVILSFAFACVLTLCSLAFLFPLNYIISSLTVSPIALLFLSSQYKATKRKLDALLHPTLYNPNAVEEYKKLLNS